MSVWPLVPVGILGAALLGLGVMASIAGRDPGFALEPNYYGKAVHWEEEQAQRAENSRLGYELVVSAEGATVVVRGTDADGMALAGADVRAEAFANAHASDVRQLAFTERAPGQYEAKLPSRRSGLWEFRFVAQHAGHRFTQVARVDLKSGSDR